MTIAVETEFITAEEFPELFEANARQLTIRSMHTMHGPLTSNFRGDKAPVQTTVVEKPKPAQFSYGRRFDEQLEHYRALPIEQRFILEDDERLNMCAHELMAADAELHAVAQRDGFNTAFKLALARSNATLLSALAARESSPNAIAVTDQEIDTRARALVANDADCVALSTSEGFYPAYRLALRKVGQQMRATAR